MKKILWLWLKKLFSDSHSSIVSIIVVALFAGSTGIYLFFDKLWHAIINTMQSPTPLWATTALGLLLGVYIYLKSRQFRKSQEPPNVQEKLHEAFGVYWNSQYNLRCLRCKWPLKCASKGHDPSIFWCSNCNTKFPLRDPNGNHLTEANAIEQLKKVLTSG